MDWMLVLVLVAVAAVGVVVWRSWRGGSAGEPGPSSVPTASPDRAGGQPEK